MKITRFSMITKWWLGVIAVLLLTGVRIAETAASPDEQLIEAAASGNLPMVKSLLDRGAGIDAKTSCGMALIEASYAGQLDVVEFLLTRGARGEYKK